MNFLINLNYFLRWKLFALRKQLQSDVVRILLPLVVPFFDRKAQDDRPAPLAVVLRG
jgi:hypothetical protein